MTPAATALRYEIATMYRQLEREFKTRASLYSPAYPKAIDAIRAVVDRYLAATKEM